MRLKLLETRNQVHLTDVGIELMSGTQHVPLTRIRARKDLAAARDFTNKVFFFLVFQRG